MKLMLMMQFPLGDWKTKGMGAWPAQDVQAHLAFLRCFNKELVEAGEFVRTEGLGGPSGDAITCSERSTIDSGRRLMRRGSAGTPWEGGRRRVGHSTLGSRDRH